MVNPTCGIEFDWFLADAAGFVAMMASAGSGRVPRWVLDNLAAHDLASDAILTLTASCDAVIVVPDSRDVSDDWIAFASRGVFAFDSDFFGAPYRLVARPSVPARLTALPPAVAAALRRAPLAPERFDHSPAFTPEGLGCVPLEA